MNVILGKAMSRRTALRGLGVTLALPFLEAMTPAFIYGQSGRKRVHRFLTFYVPNGMAMEYWTPKGTGTNFELSPILEPLAPFRDQMLVLSGLYATWVAAHAGASGSFLNGVPEGGRHETEVIADVSIDQMLARELGKQTQIASLELAIDPPANAGVCSLNLSCVYTYTLSWRGPTQALPTEYNPRAVFERLFGDSGSTERSVRQQRLGDQKSILDAVMSELSALRREIGASDRLRVEEYTEAIRDVEQRIEKAEQQIEMELPVIAQPQGAPSDFQQHVEIMLDLQHLAFRTDLTRVISFMIGAEQTGRPYPQIDVPEAHHPLSHHNSDPALVAQMSKINRYHAQLFSGFLQKLRTTPDVDGSLLDNMTILYGSGISNSDRHAGDNLPIMLVGGGAGTWKGGRHIHYDDKPWLANLLVTLMNKFDLPVERIGASTGALSIDA